MDEIKPATETTGEPAPAIAPEENLEDKVIALEAEKAKLMEEKENYRKAYLKSEENLPDEGDDRVRQIAREELANSRLLEIAREQDGIIQKALKENKELKLAQLNRKEPSAVVGAHSESMPVADTSITPEQSAYFKSRNWSDKDIERYKQNLRKKV